MEIILASKSPRRIELLKKITSDFHISPSRVSEDLSRKFSPCEITEFLKSEPQKIVQEIAIQKAEDVFSRNENSLVLSADTGVFLEGEMLGKPKDKEGAKRMLKMLSGKKHAVITGICVIKKDKMIVDFEKTLIEFNELSEDLIGRYVQTGSPLDKAGAYGIQDDFPLVKNMQGEFYNVMGFPMVKIKNILERVLGEN